MLKRSLLVVLSLAICACQKENRQETTTDTASPPPATATTSATAATGTLAGFQTPESVLYDSDQDVYFVSNINGQPVAADDNGYISRVNPETLEITAKWIDGGAPDVTLNAPKGMAISGDDLYVSDLTVVRRFDRKTGKPKGAIAIPGSTFLNDVAADGSTLYVSDSGLKAGANGFEPTGSDAIWKISGDKPQKIASSPGALLRPNGLEIVDGKLWAVSFGANELYRIENGKKVYVNTLPKGSLDGLVHLPDGTFAISSWDGKAVYRGKDNSFVAALDNIDSPADLGYDTTRHRLLVPHFMENVVTIHSMR